MNRLLFFSIGLLFVLNSFSQAYIPLLDDGNAWKVSYDGFYSCEYQYTECDYTLGNEVTINGELYKELFISSDTPNAINPHNCNTITSTPELFLYLRESLTERKVYKMDLNGQNEVVFRDYSVQIGDDLGNNISVSNISSGSVFESPSRKIDYTQTHDTFPYFDTYSSSYEGIGSTYGLLEKQSSDTTDGFSHLIEFTHNGMTSTNNQFVLATENYFTENHISLFYNVENQEISLSKFDKNIDIKLYSILGVTTLNEKSFSSLSVSNLKKGVYFYEISKENSLKKGSILIH